MVCSILINAVITGKSSNQILWPLRLGKNDLIKEHQKVLTQQRPDSSVPHSCWRKPGKALILYSAVSVRAKHQKTMAAELVGMFISEALFSWTRSKSLRTCDELKLPQKKGT